MRTDPRIQGVDGERLWASLQELRRIGATAEGGVRRLALSDEDGRARARLVSWGRDAGCEVFTDAIGNLFVRRAGTDDGLAPVLVGSHLDTQIAAGAYDGALGVLAGLELLRTLRDRRIEHRRPIEVVSWTNEEGARFVPPMMGSGVFAGAIDLERALATRDSVGITVGEELRRIDQAGSAPAGGRAVDCYFELHIEQGPELDASEFDVGIVEGGYPMRALSVTALGETAHAGPTPMPRRQNALVGAAGMIVAVDEIARRRQPDARSTSTRIESWPNLAGIVPSRAELLVDMRHPERDVLDAMVAEVRQAADVVSSQANVTIEIADAYAFGGLRFDDDCLGALRRSAERLGAPWRAMWSQAGHDAYHLAGLCRTAMLFCPCRGGISHHAAEDIDRDRMIPAVNVLVGAVLERAQRGDD